VTLPTGALRYVLSLEGDEDDSELEKLKALDPVFLLLAIKPELSRYTSHLPFPTVLNKKDVQC
jgi:hypothetical protein